jgi:hypothetical protein
MRISILPLLVDDAAGKSTVLWLEQKGTYPVNSVPESLDVANTKTKARKESGDQLILLSIDSERKERNV